MEHPYLVFVKFFEVIGLGHFAHTAPHVIYMWVVMAILIILSAVAAKTVTLVPSKGQNVFEINSNTGAELSVQTGSIGVESNTTVTIRGTSGVTIKSNATTRVSGQTTILGGSGNQGTIVSSADRDPLTNLTFGFFNMGKGQCFFLDSCIRVCQNDIELLTFVTRAYLEFWNYFRCEPTRSDYCNTIEYDFELGVIII